MTRWAMAAIGFGLGWFLFRALAPDEGVEDPTVVLSHESDRATG